MKVVTIAISAYNKQDYLNRCVQSLICPSINKLEVIIVNDGSSDNTSEIAHQWETSYPASIKVVDKENGHQGSCVNVAMDMAMGSYFKMLDADDFFDTDVLEQYVNKLEVMDVDMVITGHIICGKTPIAICPSCSVDDKIVQLEDFSFIDLGMEQCLGMHGVKYKTSILQDNHIRLTEKCSFSDAEFCYYPMRHCRTALFIAKNLYLYQTRVSGSESSLISEKVKNDAYNVTERMLNDYIKHPDIAVGGGVKIGNKSDCLDV